MSSTTSKSAFRQGFLAGMPFMIFAIPFATLFGVVATEAGLDVAQTMGFSLVVIAGASQFTAVQLMTESAPSWVVIAAALVVNLRMAMYSASLQPHLGALSFWKRATVAYCNLDQSFAVSIAKYDDQPQMPTQHKFLFFVGAVSPVMPLWILFTWVGAVAGSTIPEWLALDFAMPILFLALVGPMLRTLAHVAAAGTSVVMALILAGLPSGIGLLAAGVVAMAVGAEVERRLGRS
jgi:branched chain amino acid efflux pump